MPWQDNNEALNADVLAEFSESITRAPFDGFQGVFHPAGKPQDGAWPGQSPGWQPGDQPQPYVLALAADLAALAPATLERNELLTIRGTDYRLTRIHTADDSGWVRLDLAEHTE